ncbi:MAG: hypothetical protein LIO92_12135, partial [Clostridiales bacterium]|nr:hypothetical protein [Clostridiales bacterium]
MQGLSTEENKQRFSAGKDKQEFSIKKNKQGFSLEYLMFYDKLEKANHFLTMFMDHLKEPLDSPDNRYLLSNPVSDRGQWGMAVSLIKKYGLIPLCENESFIVPASTGELNEEGGNVCEYQGGFTIPAPTAELNACLNYMLRCFAKRIRESFENGSSQQELNQIKEEAMQGVRGLLEEYYGSEIDSTHLPDGSSVTPQEYFERNYGDFFYDYISIISNERMNPGQYDVDLEGNVTGSTPDQFLNLP